MANQNVRVQIPRNVTELLTLAENIYEKHQADAAASPLNTLQDANWKDNGDKIAQAQALDEKAKQMQKDLEGLFEQRDLLVQPLLATVKASRDLLLGIYTSNPKKLGDWGFSVDDSPKAKKDDGTKPA